MKNKRFIKQDVNDQRVGLTTMYRNKYYNIFMNSLKWNGLSAEQSNYVMKRFWSDGTIASFPVKSPIGDEVLDLGFAPYSAYSWNMYDFPEQVQLINLRNVPFIPSTPQIVNRDVVLGFIQPNHKGIMSIVYSYIDRMVAVDMVINTNLATHKMPFLIGVAPEDVQRAQDVIDRILNDELVVFTDLEELNAVKSLATSTPMIIKELCDYRSRLEGELKTYLGIDNNNVEKGERLIVDEVNANNSEINYSREGILMNLKNFTDNINEFFGVNVSVEPLIKEQVASVHESDGGNSDENNQ